MKKKKQKTKPKELLSELAKILKDLEKRKAEILKSSA